jgi:hypothetical protein
VNDAIPWADRPPPLPTARIWSPPPGTSFACLLGPWYALWVHWIGKRSVPCMNQDCPRHTHSRPMRWCAYAPACVPTVDNVTRKITAYTSVILPLSPEQATAVLQRLGSYPGPTLKIKKADKRRGFTITDILPVLDGPPLPSCPDVEATLYRLWGRRPPSQVDEDPVS